MSLSGEQKQQQPVAAPEENFIIQYIKHGLKSQAETQARLERELEAAKGMPAAQKAVELWLAESPEVRKYVKAVQFREDMTEMAVRRQLSYHSIGTPLQLMAHCIENMRPRSASGSFGLSQKLRQLWNRLDRIANMVKHQKVPGPKACENLARLAAERPDADRSELRQDLLNLGQRMQEAYDWIKQEKKRKRE